MTDRPAPSGIDLRDSMDDDPSTLPTVCLACPQCATEVAVDPADVVRHGLVTGLDPDVDAEPWPALLAAGVVVRRAWGTSSTLADPGDLTPYVADVVCGACRARSWAVVGWGEFQPARYRCTVWPLV